MEGAKQGITFYLHYGDQEIAEMDETGAILTYYVLGAGVDQRTAMIKNTGTCRAAFLARQADCF